MARPKTARQKPRTIHKSSAARTDPDEIQETILAEPEINLRGFGWRSLQPLVRPHEVENRSSQLQKCLCRFKALEVAHGFVPLLDVLVVALNGVVVMFQPVAPRRDRNTVDKPRHVVEVPVESPLVLSEFVADEGYELSVFRRRAPPPRENLVYLPSYAPFQLLEESVDLLQGSAPDQPCAQVILGPAVDDVYAPNLFFPTFSSTSSRCIRPLTLGLGMRLRSNFLTILAYFLTQSKIVESAGL